MYKHKKTGLLVTVLTALFWGYASPVHTGELLLHWRFYSTHEASEYSCIGGFRMPSLPGSIEKDASGQGHAAQLHRADLRLPYTERVSEGVAGGYAGSVRLHRFSSVRSLNPVKLPESWTLSFWIRDERSEEEIPDRLEIGEIVSIKTRLLGFSRPWHFRKDPVGKGTEKAWERGGNGEAWERINVPAFWAETHAGDYLGYGWYKTRFYVPEDLAGMEHELHFEAVDEQAWVYVNGELIGEQSVESTGRAAGDIWDEPFSVTVEPEHLKAGEENLLVVRAHAGGGHAGIFRPVCFVPPEEMQRDVELGQISGERASAGEWEHVALTVDSGKASLYINGVPAAVDERIQWPLDTRRVQLGEYFTGLLSDVRLFEGALREERIAELSQDIYHSDAEWIEAFGDRMQELIRVGELSGEAADYLVDLGAPDAEALAETLRTSDIFRDRMEAMWALSELGGYEAVAAFIETMASGHGKLFRPAEKELQRLADAGDFPDLLRERADSESILLLGKVLRYAPDVRLQFSATDALGSTGDEAAADTLVAAAQERERDFGVRVAAVEALNAMGIDHDTELPVATDWPMWRYDAARSADAPLALAGELHLQWVRELPEPKRAWPHQWDDRGKLEFDASYTPVAAGGRVYVPSNVTDSVTAYNIRDGQEIWRFYADGPVRLAPAAWDGKVYFVSDDGHLYCVDGETGELVWNFRGGPSDHRLLGNERIINFWAARGGPVVTEGTVYFAAGIWPLHGVFIYALDARSGEVVWVNDTTSSDYVRLPHGGARGYGGLVPQGYLAVDGDRLVVPGGRTPPVFLNRHTGESSASSFRAKPGGGYAVAAGGIAFRRSETLVDRVKAVSDQIEGDVYIETDRAGDGFAGRHLRDDADGTNVFYKLAAQNRLILSTEDGRIYCFGPEEVETVRYEYSPVPLELQTERWSGIAEDLLERLGESEGYALVLGAGSGDLLKELLRRSSLHVVVVEQDGNKVRALRDELAAAGQYGRHAAVIEADPASFSVQPYLFSLIVSEDAPAAGLKAEKSVMSNVLDNLRPYGGIAWLGAAKQQALSNLFQAAKDAEVDQVSVKSRSRRHWLFFRRDHHLFARRGGPLAGAGQWTHQYSDPSNTNFSADTLAKAPLGVLWFGGPTNDNILPRHGFGPAPQITRGRTILLGPETISARCVYTGREIWEREFPGIGHPFTDLDKEKRYRQGEGVHMSRAAPFVGANMLGSPYVSMPDGIYVRYKTSVYRLDPQSGEITEEFQLPVDPQLEGLPDWGHISVAGDRLIATVEPQVAGDEHYSQVFQKMGDIKTRARDGISSSRLVVMDRCSGEVLWTHQAEIGFRHNTIVAANGRVHLIDGLTGETTRKLLRRGKEAEKSTLMTFDIDTGEQKWNVSSEIFGTWLGYSICQDILVEGGRQNSGARHRTLDDEPVDRIAAYRGSDGTLVWRKNVPGYHGPLSISADTVYLAPAGTSGASRALHLKTGELKMRIQSHTGESATWSYSRRYGCGTHNVSEHLITFRTGSAGFFDLKHDSGTGTLSGFRSGCTNNMIAADGVLNAPDYTRTCYCSYAHQTSLAMVHMPEDSNIEYWTRYDGSFRDPEGHGINFGAPGRRVDVAGNGRLWHDESGTARRHPSAVEENGGSPDWVMASVREFDQDGETILINELLETEYNIRLHFCELDEEVRAGERVFDVLVDGTPVAEALDIVAVTGGSLRGMVVEFSTEAEGGNVTVELRAHEDSDRYPVISGIELEAAR